MEYAVKVENVRVSFGSTQALKNVSLQVELGSITAILGPNGAGKTTLIERCEGFGSIDSGSITILGTHPKDPKLRPAVGAMLQSGGAWAGVRAMEMLEHVSRMYGQPHDVAQLAHRLGIDQFGSTQYRRLSGGQAQRLNLALALVGRPALVFLDEPTASLDAHARRDTWALLRSLKEQGVTVVLTTHYLEEAESLADQVFILHRGEIVASGAPEQLAAQTSSLTTIRFDRGFPLSEANQSFPEWTLTATADPAEIEFRGEMTPERFVSFAQWCQQRNLLITRYASADATLEDAFLALTGEDTHD